MEGIMEGLEGSLSRRMDTLEVRQDYTHSSPKNYHDSSSGHAPHTSPTITPKILYQMFYPPRQVHEPINQVPTYPNNQNQIHQEAPQNQEMSSPS